MDGSKLKARIEALRAEQESGRARLTELEAQAASVRESLLRIAGAIEVLEEAARESSPET